MLSRLKAIQKNVTYISEEFGINHLRRFQGLGEWATALIIDY